MNNIDRTKRVSSDFRRLKLSSGTACTPLDMLSAIRVEIELSLHNYAPGSLSKPQISWTY